MLLQLSFRPSLKTCTNSKSDMCDEVLFLSYGNKFLLLILQKVYAGKQGGSTKLHFGGKMAEIHVHNYVAIEGSHLHGYLSTAVTVLAKYMHQGTKLNLEFIKSTAVLLFYLSKLPTLFPFLLHNVEQSQD